jgi:mediator of RNA polymerase II transcription subunit 13, fungi type
MNGIDFFKSCSTNVRVVENVFDLQYMVFSQPPESNRAVSIGNALADLRKRGVLCAAPKEELLIFATPENASEVPFDCERYGLGAHDSSWKNFDLTTKVGIDEPLEGVLLDAIEGCITYFVGWHADVWHAGRLTWVFFGNPEEEAESAAGTVVMHMEMNLAETGVLYLSTKTAYASLKRFGDIKCKPTGDVLLAPIGRLAKVITDDGASSAIIRLASRNSGWAFRISKALLADGISLYADLNNWLVVEMLLRGKRHRFAWPLGLCFTADQNVYSEHDDMLSSFSWMRWFRVSQHSFKNPLAEAEAWATRAFERERALNTTSEPMNLDGAPIHSTNTVAETPLATSPPFNQRFADQQAALSGIYPTPPDGLMPGQPLQLPTSDGAIGALQVEHSALSNGLQVPSSDDNVLGAASMESNGDAQTYPMNSDDLFGDMGEMDFGANEVGDADFDYFDEPDELPQMASIDEDVDMAEDSAEFNGQHEAVDKIHEGILNDEDVIATDEPTVPDSRPASSHDPAKHDHEARQGQDEPIPTAEASQDVSSSPQGHKEPEKPLSPWGIRRQLLPMIPASTVSTEVSQTQSKRRTSTFEPMAFNENLDLGSKYAINKPVEFAKSGAPPTGANTNLPNKENQNSYPKPNEGPDPGVTDLDSPIEYDSHESNTSMSEDENMPPRLPWDTKKRKRSSWREQDTPPTSATDSIWTAEDKGDTEHGDFGFNQMVEVVDSLLRRRTKPKVREDRVSPQPSSRASLSENLSSVEDMFELEKMDLVYIAQIVSEQAISSISMVLQSITDSPSLDNYADVPGVLESTFEAATRRFLPALNECSISKLALVKEPPPRPTMNPGKAPATGQPRPLQREGSMQLGPDYFPLPPPFVRVQRGSDTYEMLPPALSFWSALGLGPVNGTKDIAPIALVPSATDVVRSVQDFMKDLGGIYESRKLGSFSRPPEMNNDLGDISLYDDGCFLLNLDEDLLTVDGALKMFAEVCEDVGQGLAELTGQVDPDRTIVIFFVDPFESEELCPRLATCFWKLCKAYRQHVPKSLAKSSHSDLVLQLIPISLIADWDKLVVLDAESLSSLAMEVYDRCPPSSKVIAAMDTPSALPILAAPSIELAPGAKQKVVFQLTIDPPNDLMHEGSVLHIAYALSADMQWMAVNWMDTTGKYQMSTSASLRGRSFKDTATEVWERTMDILAARDVTWRIFIVTNGDLDASEAKCWRKLVSSKMRRQAFHATLLSTQTDTSLQLTAPSSNETNGGYIPGQSGAFLTPGSTPQALTVSPDASGQTAPPTPAASDPHPVNAENEPGAHLIDTTDESWGMLLSPTFIATLHDETSNIASTLARGMLFRRDNTKISASSDKLESLGVNLHWDIRIRPNGAIDEGPPKQPEATLRDVLRMYRNLGLLARARNLVDARGSRMMPVHLVAATRAADALSWFKI